MEVLISEKKYWFYCFQASFCSSESCQALCLQLELGYKISNKTDRSKSTKYKKPFKDPQNQQQNGKKTPCSYCLRELRLEALVQTADGYLINML